MRLLIKTSHQDLHCLQNTVLVWNGLFHLQNMVSTSVPYRGLSQNTHTPPPHPHAYRVYSERDTAPDQKRDLKGNICSLFRRGLVNRISHTHTHTHTQNMEVLNAIYVIYIYAILFINLWYITLSYLCPAPGPTKTEGAIPLSFLIWSHNLFINLWSKLYELWINFNSQWTIKYRLWSNMAAFIQIGMHWY